MAERSPRSQPIDLTRVPLSGTQLVEASAGTGKTFTIAALYQRLVLEAGIPLERILVVTFTEAAAAELKGRLRRALVELRQLFAGATPADALQVRLLADGDERELRRVRLEAALRNFDDAAIHTIHGFCQRALADSAFECGGAFEIELVPDQEALLQEVVDDFWRLNCYPASPLFAAYLLSRGQGPEPLARELRRLVNKPDAELRGPAPPRQLEAQEQALLEQWERLRQISADSGDEAVALLCSGALRANSYAPARVPGWYQELEAYLRQPLPGFRPPAKLGHFCASKIRGAVKKGATGVPEHELFDAAEAFASALEDLTGAFQRAFGRLQQALLEWARAELHRRQLVRRQRGFDDLIGALRQALGATGGVALRNILRQRYRAALIDEFQDTDPAQYEIFRGLFADGSTPLFLVGDPKQAIYGFRGADLFAYLRARRDATQHWSLLRNWRSEAGLIGAVNAIFSAVEAPFLLPEMEFEAAVPGPCPPPALLERGHSQSPLRLWLLGADEEAAPSVERAQARVVAAVAEEVVRLLTAGGEGRARLVAPDLDRPLEGGDIAILVRTNRQAQAVAQGLGGRGVACVQLGDDSVFESAEAEQLERVLLALADPGREALVRTALCTPLLGLRAAKLNAALDHEGAGFEPHLERFHELNDRWRERGFMAAFQALLRHYRVQSRLLAWTGGERSLTNVLHLGELLHTAAHRERLGVAELPRWLSDRRARLGTGGDDASALRLETDARLVKVVTVHKSKGLEYPVVLCPFLWHAGPRRAETPVVFHDPALDHRLVLDFGSERCDAGQGYAALEGRAEELRLLYVALTRAKNRCYLAWGPVSGAERSPLAWLLHQPPESEPKAASELVTSRFKTLGLEGVRADLARLLQRADGTIEVAEPPVAGTGRAPAPEAAATLAGAATLRRELRQSWRITSFSALLGSHGGEELPDRDPVAIPEPVSQPPEMRGLGAAEFPRGPGPGSCLHQILETWDFADADDNLEKRVEESLASYGIESRWTDLVVHWMRRVARTPLDPAGWALRDLPLRRRVHELEFHYPVHGLDAHGLAQRLCALGGVELGAAAERLGALEFELRGGFLRGFVDLIFEQAGCYYLADFKSNWLGPELTDYDSPRLATSMEEEGYHLQHLLYLVALHRYLGVRLSDYDYDTHVGGVLYLYLRGMDPDGTGARGVYRLKPPAALVRSLDDWLLGREP